MVMNGPTPIMSIMFSAVAVPRPMPRISFWSDMASKLLAASNPSLLTVRAEIFSVHLVPG
jgi:hypothetical protein